MVICFKIFPSNINILYTIIWFQVIIIFWNSRFFVHKVSSNNPWFQIIILSKWSQVIKDNNPYLNNYSFE